MDEGVIQKPEDKYLVISKKLNQEVLLFRVYLADVLINFYPGYKFVQNFDVNNRMNQSVLHYLSFPP